MANETYDRFNLPVAPFLERLLAERYPDLDVAPGSALHDLLITPAAFLLQPHRDYMRVAARNLKIRNYAAMNESELDALASNFLVARRDGTRARGTQRVYFSRPQAVMVAVAARFFDAAGRAFVPASAVGVSLSEMTANYDTASAQYFVDVPITASVDGTEYAVGAGSITVVQGVPGAVRTSNLKALTPARDRDSNTELYRRVLGSVVNRDLVKSASIQATIQDNFATVRAVRVAGFGDAAMTRDVVRASLAAQPLFRFSHCLKYNLPLDATGAVNHYEADGISVVQTPVGGRVGAIVDALDIDFFSIPVSLDGVETIRTPLQPGFRIRLFGADADDPDIGDYVVTQVTDAPAEPGGIDVRIALLDRPLDLESDPGDAVDKFRYTIVGSVASERFHVGGKVDVYVDSTADVEKEVIVSSLVTDDNGVAEVPLTASATLPSGAPMFENAVGFENPVVVVARIEEMSFTADVVLSTLTPGVNYVVVRQANRSRYTLADNDVLIIRGTRSDGTARYAGSRLRVTYLTNSDYAAIQTYLDDDMRRDVARDILVKPPQTLLLDLDFAYRGPLEQADVAAYVQEYVAGKGFMAEVTVNEILTLLAGLGVTDVALPMTLTSYYDLGTGETTVTTSQDRIVCSSAQVFRVLSTPSIRRLS